MTSAYELRSTAYLTNASFGLSFLRDAPPDERKTRLEFHVASGDYFGTLATVLGLMADMLPSDNPMVQYRCAKNLNEIRDDLVYLQETHRIERN